jgi:hypothetical protein
VTFGADEYVIQNRKIIELVERIAHKTFINHDMKTWLPIWKFTNDFQVGNFNNKRQTHGGKRVKFTMR